MSVRSALALGFGLALAVAAAAAQQPPDELTSKQINMLAAEVQFFNALARQQKDELDKMKAANPCSEPK
jgi:hypothetical protein